MHKVEELKIWKKSMELVKQVYQVLADMPENEKYGLTSQIKRCAVSIPSNIAEGAGRTTNKEFKYFLGIANGSSYELQTQLMLKYELQLLDKYKIDTILSLLSEIQKMNYSFQKSLEDVSILNTKI